MEITFCELRAKEVINIYDGRSLGNITDMVIDTACGRVLGIIVPKDRSLFNIFKSNSDFFIPYNRICKIGKDIILVELTSHQINSLSNENKNLKKNKDNNYYSENTKTENKNIDYQSQDEYYSKTHKNREYYNN